MNIADIYPPNGHVQRLYCSNCGGSLDLAYTNFNDDVSRVRITIIGLPVLRCLVCCREYLPDRFNEFLPQDIPDVIR
jgi:hypothetical protein